MLYNFGSLFFLAEQIVIWFIIPASRSSRADHTNNALVLIVLLQYVPRLYLIFPLSSKIIKTTGLVTKTAWAGAAYNLLLYMLASHVCSFLIFQFHFVFLTHCELLFLHYATVGSRRRDSQQCYCFFSLGIEEMKESYFISSLFGSWRLIDEISSIWREIFP